MAKSNSAVHFGDICACCELFSVKTCSLVLVMSLGTLGEKSYPQKIICRLKTMFLLN